MKYKTEDIVKMNIKFDIIQLSFGYVELLFTCIIIGKPFYLLSIISNFKTGNGVKILINFSTLMTKNDITCNLHCLKLVFVFPFLS